MAAILGPRMAADLIFAVGGMDAARILNFQNRNGLNMQDVIGRAAAAVGTVNEAVMARWGGVSYITTMDYARYRAGTTGGARKTPKRTEAANPDPVKGTLSGHMLPIQDYEDSLAWSEQYLRDAYDAQIDADIQEAVDDFEYRTDVDFINRIFSSAENAIGSGYDVGWAIGTGSNVNFIPPPYRGTSFLTTHNHYNVNSGTDAAAALALAKAMAADLREHGFSGTLQMFVSLSDIALWTAATGFVEIVPPQIQIFAGASSTVRAYAGEASGVPGELFGYLKLPEYGLIELRYLPNIPQYSCWMTKSFGVNNPKNGVAVRVHPDIPFGLVPDPQITMSLQPRLDSINLKATHGVGVNQRLNGVAGQLNTSSYSFTLLT